MAISLTPLQVGGPRCRVLTVCAPPLGTPAQSPAPGSLLRRDPPSGGVTNSPFHSPPLLSPGQPPELPGWGAPSRTGRGCSSPGPQHSDPPPPPPHCRQPSKFNQVVLLSQPCPRLRGVPAPCLPASFLPQTPAPTSHPKAHSHAPGQRRPSAVRGLQARRRWGLQTRPQHGVARHAGAHLRGRRAVLAALGGRRWSIFPARGHSQRAPSPGPPRPRPGRRGERRATREPEPSPAEPRPLPSHPPPAAALKATESRFPRADSAPGPRRALGAGPLTPGQVDKEPPGPRSRGAARLGTPTLDSRGCSGARPPRPFGTEDAERRRGRGGESSGAGVQQGRGPCPRSQRCSGVGVDPLQATPQPTPGMPAAAPQWCCTRRGGVSSRAFPGLR